MFYTESTTLKSNNANWKAKTAGSIQSAVLVQQEIEYIFSNENLKKDSYLHDHMDVDGWVDIKVVANYRQIKSLTNDVRVVAMAAALVDHLEFSHCGSKLRKEMLAKQLARNMPRKSERSIDSPSDTPLTNLHTNQYNSRDACWQTKTADSLEKAVLIKEKVEYIFSNENLKKDSFLHDHMDIDGWVDIKVIANYRQIKSLTSDVRVVAMAASLIDQFEFSHCGSRMRKVMPARQQARNSHPRHGYNNCMYRHH